MLMNLMCGGEQRPQLSFDLGIRTVGQLEGVNRVVDLIYGHYLCERVRNALI